MHKIFVFLVQVDYSYFPAILGQKYSCEYFYIIANDLSANVLGYIGVLWFSSNFEASCRPNMTNKFLQICCYIIEHTARIDFVVFLAIFDV